jgi:hypothetical protein
MTSTTSGRRSCREFFTPMGMEFTFVDFRDPENVKKVRSGEETFGGWSQFATREREM